MEISLSRTIWKEQDVKIYLYLWHVLKNWNLRANEKIKSNEDAKHLAYYGMKQIMYMSINFQESEENFIGRATEAVLDLFDEVGVAGELFEDYIWTYYSQFGKYYESFQVCVCLPLI